MYLTNPLNCEFHANQCYGFWIEKKEDIDTVTKFKQFYSPKPNRATNSTKMKLNRNFLILGKYK